MQTGLGAVFAQLEPLLTAAVAAGARAAAEGEAPSRPGPNTVRRALAQDLDAPPLGADLSLPDFSGLDPRLDRLIGLFDLDAVDAAILALALAPEVEPRYPPLFACALGDPGLKRPTVGLLADLLCDDAGARRRLVAELDSSARPVVRLGLVRIGGDSSEPAGRRPVRLDPQAANWLLGAPVLDSALAAFVRIDAAAPADWARIDPLAAAVLEASAEPRLQVIAGPVADGLMIARAVAAARGQGLLVADLGALPQGADAVAPLDRLVRQAWLWEATVVVERLSRLDEFPQGAALLVENRLAALPGGCLALSPDGWTPGAGWPSGVRLHALKRGDVRRSAAAWREAAGRFRRPLGEEDVETLASSLRLQPSEIFSAVASVDPADSRLETLRAAARRNTGQALERLAARVVPSRSFADLVAPPAVDEALGEILTLMRGRRLARDAGLPQGPPGVVALFAGPSGSGKSLAGEVLAYELGLDLFRAETASLIDKYIGETEKNLERLFAAAEDAQAVLLFDEADALFGKRSEVTDSRDRYANQEVAYLLQRLERFDGLAILSTNLIGGMDEAFQRRLEVVYFPFPGTDERERLWRLAFPAPERGLRPVEVDEGVDWRALAEAHVLSGGHIHAAARTAVIFARSEGRAVTRADLERAVVREFTKLGRPTVGGVRG